MRNISTAMMIATLTLASHGQSADPVSSPKSSQGQPFWRAKTMENEPVLFIRNEGKPFATGKLLFMPSAKPTIMAPDLVMKYEEGKDYVWKPGSNMIELTAGTRIPFKTSAEMVPPPGSPNTMMGVLFAEGHFFHDLQVQVSYPHAADWPLKDVPPAQRLTRSLAKLNAKQPLKLVALGDSITNGSNASGFVVAPPHQPPYPQLVANALQQRFGASVTLTNLARGGTAAGWGLEMVAKVATEKPDLVILAFGMNHSEPAAGFEAVMRKLRDAVQAACPEADIVLVAPMTGNPCGFPPERFTGYREVLRNLTGPNVALADVTSPWLELLKRKPFSDLSGNNINHPNDFGHRVYAQIICELFPLKSESIQSAAVKSVRLILPKQPGPVVENTGKVFVRQVQQRCEAKVVTGAAAAADDGAKGGDKTANAAEFSARLPIGPPVIGAWFPEENEMRNPDGYRDFLDAAAGYSHYTLLSTTMRIPGRQMTDAYVHDWFKRAAAYARQRGVGLVLELDPRHSIPAFAQQYPKALQQRLWLREVDLAKEGEAVVEIGYGVGHGDAICGAGVNAIALERVYVYGRTSAGIEPDTVQDVTASCTVRDTGKGKRSVFIPSGDAGSKERKACVIMRVTFNYPAVFSPEILQFEADTVRQYADLPLTGLMKDEAGYPAAHDGNPHKNGFWTSSWREADYARRTGGRDLVRDSLLMCYGEAGREAERQSAVNHFMEQSRHRNSVIEQAFYKQTKATFGPDAFVGTHDTVFPYPDAREFERNGLNWWTATRDYAQSDEITPYSCRTSMAKKMGGGVWYNQWYSPDIATYEKGIWRYALAGGRMNFHVLYPSKPPWVERGKDLLRSSLLRGDSRIRLLNCISDAPVDCPVAVIFGHANVMNWAGPSFNDIGTQLTDLFWQAGMYADLIPSTEIAEKALRVDDNGDVWYGKQRYAAVVLYRPEFENAATVEFFQRAARGKTILYRIGDWTKDFNGKPLDANAALPPPMKGAVDITTCAREVIAKLTEAGVQPKTPASGMFPKWNGQGRESADMPASGHTRLTDGTVILVAGEKDRTGDPIQETIEVHGHKVTFDAAGVAAVRLSEDGKFEAMAAGGLRHFKAGPVEIKLDQPADVALWRDPKGTLQGVLQGYEGDVPADLAALTSNWLRLELPPQLNEN